MVDKKELRKELILKYPNDTATKLLVKAQKKGISNRKSEFLKEVRNLRKIPEPSIAKKERSIPIKYRSSLQKSRIAKRKPTPKRKPIPKKFPTVLKPKAKIPFAKTKFGRIVKDLESKHGISEKNAILRARKLLKIPKVDYNQLNTIDYDILIHYGY